MMLPILEPLSPEAFGPARDLGNAFQLTNFLRDINEDLDLGRVYVPQQDIRRFGADAAFAERRVTPAFVALMSFEIDRTRQLYKSAERGVALLPPSSARCIDAARVLYSRILDVIEANGYDVFSARASVPTWQKAAVVLKGISGHRRRARVARRARSGRGTRRARRPRDGGSGALLAPARADPTAT